MTRQDKSNDVIGISIIELSTDDFTMNIVEDSKLTVVPLCTGYNSRFLHDHLLYLDSDNNPVYGQRAYYKSPELSLNIEPGRREGDPSLVKVKYTLGKILQHNNYETVNVSEFMRATEQTQNRILQDVGIEVDLKNAKIIRLDIQTTMEFKESLDPLFDGLKELKKIGYLTQEYAIEQNVRWMNYGKALCIYNKVREFDDYPLSDNYINALCVEYRLMTHRAVQDSLGITNVSELTQTKVNETLLGFIKPVIERLEPKLYLTVEEPLQKTFDIFKEKKGKTNFQDFIKNIGLLSLRSKYGINEISEVINGDDYTNSGYKRIMKNIGEISRDLSSYQNNLPKSQLFDALKSNLFGDNGSISAITGSILCS